MSTSHHGAVRSHVASIESLRRRIERFRIREHLRRAERALRAADHDHLTPEQRRKRERHLDRLSEYRKRDEFPTIDGASRTPRFVGVNGVPCAMAYLLCEAGRDDLVESVMDENPTVYVEDLPDSHPVIEWVEENGLTREEAARIQPSYPSAVEFATTCGSVPCWLAGLLVSLVGATVFAASEYVGYRLVSDVFPDNALKRRSVLAYVTAMNLLVAPMVALVLFALFP